MTLNVGMQHRVLKYYQMCSNDDPGFLLTYFTARSNLVPYAFVWEKGKTKDVSCPTIRRGVGHIAFGADPIGVGVAS